MKEEQISWNGVLVNMRLFVKAMIIGQIGHDVKQLDRGNHICDEPDPAHEGYSLALFCLVTIETDESEKYKHLSSQVTNEIVCLIGI